MWKNIAGQKRVKEKLSSIYFSGKIANAYLFYGPDGVGKDAAAIEFAKLLNCDNPSSKGSCDICSSCRKIQSLRSELLYLITALPRGASDDTGSDPVDKLSQSEFERYLEELEEKSINPYHKILIQGANNIRINSIRWLIEKIYLTSNEGKVKVFLISEADKMRQEAANALLKVLEEPPRGSLLILTSSKVNLLPETITGRCQGICFESLKTNEIIEKLSERSIWSEKDISLAAKLSGGSYANAEKFLNNGIKEYRDMVINFLISSIKNDYSELASVSKIVSSGNDRERTRYFLFILNLWFRDLMYVRHGNVSESELVNYDLRDRLMRLNTNYPDADIFNIIKELEESERLLNQNVQPYLILVNLGIKLSELIDPERELYSSS